MAALNKRLLQPGERIRVLVVDDSVVIRRLVTHALEQDPALEVVGAASNGAIALQRIPQFNPDVLTLDIEMPEMDGLETLRRVRREYPQLRVIMFSTLTERGAAVTLEALTPGSRRLRGQGLERRLARPLDGAPAGRTGPEDQTVLSPGWTEPYGAKVRGGPGGRGVADLAGRPGLREREAAAQGSRDRSFHRRPDRAGRDSAAVAGRVSAAGSGGAAHAAAVHAVACRAAQRHLPPPRRGSGPGRADRKGQDPDRARRLSHESRSRRRPDLRLVGSIAAAELLPSGRRCAVCFGRGSVRRRRDRRRS